MAKLREYVSRVDKLTPTDIGFSAEETAARRLQLLYGQAATETRQAARAEAADITKATSTQASDIEKQASIGAGLITDLNREALGRGGGGTGGGGERSSPFPNGGGAGAARQMTAVAAGVVVPQAPPEFTSPPRAGDPNAAPDAPGQGPLGNPAAIIETDALPGSQPPEWLGPPADTPVTNLPPSGWDSVTQFLQTIGGAAANPTDITQPE